MKGIVLAPPKYFFSFAMLAPNHKIIIFEKIAEATKMWQTDFQIQGSDRFLQTFKNISQKGRCPLLVQTQ